MNSNDSDLEIQSNRKPSGRGRGRGRGRPPGRPKKNTKKKVIKEEDVDNDNDIENNVNSVINSSNDEILQKFDESLESSLTSNPMSFVSHSSTIPLHKSEPLNWKYRVNLIGEKVVNPRIHCCEKCQLPILVYGRMIACKHVFCLSCAQKNENVCPRCHEKVLRVEKSGLGTVFMCQTESCKRTYLSQRDLQAHIQHRHVRRLVTSSAANPSIAANIMTTTSSVTSAVIQTHNSTTSSNSRPVSFNSNTYQSPIPVVSNRSNLITVPIQEEFNTNLNSMQQNVNNQTSHIVSGQQTVSNYVSAQPPPYAHHTPHIQWPAMPPNPNTFSPYRPAPPPWPPMANPYNPYNRPFYHQ